MADVEQILRAYGLRLRKNSRLTDLYRNAKDYADAMAYAKGSGDGHKWFLEKEKNDE